MLDLPRSALLAAWGTAFLDGRVPLGAAVRAVTGGDEPHTVDGLTDASDLPGLLPALRSAGVRGLRLVLPVPGDVLGLPGPPELNRAALEAGEVVLAEAATPSVPSGPSLPSGGAWGIVPQVTEFGSAWEPGALVRWHVRPALPRRVTDVGSVREAERGLREALRTATEELARLDVARWRDDAADRVAAVRDGGLPAGTQPAGTPPRAVQVLATAQRVRAIVELATEDDGAAVTGWEAQRRTEALRGLESVTRRAVVAAVNAALEPG